MQKKFFVNAQIREIKKTSKEIMSFVDSLNITDQDKFNLEMVLNEALSNAVQYGSMINEQAVEVIFEIKDRLFTLQIKDFGGKMFDPVYFETMALIKEWGKGGRGIFLMKEFMDVVQYVIYPEKSTLLFLTKQF